MIRNAILIFVVWAVFSGHVHLVNRPDLFTYDWYVTWVAHP